MINEKTEGTAYIYSHVQLFTTPWPGAHQPPLSMGFSRQEYWSGLPCPPSGDLPNPSIKPKSPASPALPGRWNSLPLSHLGLCLVTQAHLVTTKYKAWLLLWGEVQT